MAMTADRAASSSASVDAQRQSSSARPGRSIVIHLAEQAAKRNADPCDLCEEALPAYVLGDLEQIDKSWIDAHTRSCNYCRNELECFEKLDTLVDRCCAMETADLPPLPVLPQQTAHRQAAYGTVDSPLGQLYVAVSDAGVCEIGFGWLDDETDFEHRLAQRGFAPLRNQARIQEIAGELNDYFSGRRNQFEVPLDFSGLTPFSRAVLDATAHVPFGETRTYQEIARAIGNPGATRAVGNALNKNPIPLVVPCHRILPTGRGIGKYAGGVEAKHRLLTLEGAIPASTTISITR
jgi:methylated-DNA-[protein]-cysteine S-methyltransferase